MDRFVLESPLDMHVHFRQGPMLQRVVPLTAAHFAGALVMPNTEPPINSKDRLLDYKREVWDAAQPHNFAPYFTAYFQTHYGRKWLEEMREHLLAIKLYPKGMTTNSSHGVDPEDPDVERVIGDMEELGIPLCVHGEASGFVMRREKLFRPTYIKWATKFPRLKIIMEHITTAETALLLGQYENLYATITVQHALCTLDDLAGELLNPHMFCKPILKEPEDRDLLYRHVFRSNSNQHKVMLGTDSAPHAQNRKECACGCAGCFTAPIALQRLAQEYAKVWANDPQKGQERFQLFVSGAAQKIYGITPLKKKVTLERKPFQIPATYGDVVPLWAGSELEWSVTNVTAS